jgi:predicted AAA+ superfamily ATPase
VAHKADRIIYLQIAYLLPDEQTSTREYASLESIRDNYEKHVVSLDDVQFAHKSGIKHIQEWNLGKIL